MNTHGSIPPTFAQFTPEFADMNPANIGELFAALGTVVFSFGVLEDEVGKACGRIIVTS